MAHDLVIRNGLVVDGTGAEPVRADVRDRRRPHCRRRRGRRPRDPGDRRGGPVRHAGLRRHPHASRRAARLGPDRILVLLARRHVGGARQLRRHLRALQAGRSAVPRRDDGVRRGHPGRLDHGRPGLGLGVLRRVPGRRRPHAEGHQRGRHGRPLRGPHSRDGRARARPGAGIRRGRDRDLRARRRGDRRRRARLLHLAHRVAPRARRSARAGHLRRRARAHGDRPRDGRPASGRVRERTHAGGARTRTANAVPAARSRCSARSAA